MTTSDAASPPAPRHSPGEFPSTFWTVVETAARGDPATAWPAIRQLLEMYQQPIRRWFEFQRGLPEAPEDWAQDFLLYLQQENRFIGLVRGETQFRSFLKRCLTNFLRSKLAAHQAQKRGGGQEHLDAETMDLPVQGADAGRLLDRAIALEVHGRAFASVEEQWRRRGHTARWQELVRFLDGDDRTMRYQDVAAHLGMSEGHVKKAVFDLREDYHDAFLAEVRGHTRSASELMEEMRYLLSLLPEETAAVA